MNSTTQRWQRSTEESVAREGLLMQISNLGDQVQYFRDRSSGEMVEGAAGEYTEEDYLALEAEKSGLAFQVSILNRINGWTRLGQS